MSTPLIPQLLAPGPSHCPCSFTITPHSPWSSRKLPESAPRRTNQRPSHATDHSGQPTKSIPPALSASRPRRGPLDAACMDGGDVAVRNAMQPHPWHPPHPASTDLAPVSIHRNMARTRPSLLSFISLALRPRHVTTVEGISRTQGSHCDIERSVQITAESYVKHARAAQRHIITVASANPNQSLGTEHIVRASADLSSKLSFAFFQPAPSQPVPKPRNSAEQVLCTPDVK